MPRQKYRFGLLFGNFAWESIFPLGLVCSSGVLFLLSSGIAGVYGLLKSVATLTGLVRVD